jgi:hypothetical protein
LGHRPGCPPSVLHRRAAALERRQEGLACAPAGCARRAPGARQAHIFSSCSRAGGARCAALARAGLTSRSTGPATAAVVSPACASRTIVAVRAYAVCLRRPVSSNVRPRLAAPWRASTRLAEASRLVNLPLRFGQAPTLLPRLAKARLRARLGAPARFLTSCSPPPCSGAGAPPRRSGLRSRRWRSSRTRRPAKAVFFLVPSRRGRPVRCARAGRPNQSLNRTRYGSQRKPGPRPLRHHRVPGLRCLPPQAG